MKITMDNGDGRGAVDYTSAVDLTGPITIQRGLNVPSRCTTKIFAGCNGLVLPVRYARVVVTSENGTMLFTGYVATEPVQEYVGEAAEGPLYRAVVTAVSDEWLLDKLGSGANIRGNLSLWLSGEGLVNTLMSRVQAGGAAMSVTAPSPVRMTGAFSPSVTAPWSANAGDAASAAYAHYRAMGGGITVQPAGGATHAFSDADGTLTLAELKTGTVRELANDVTLTGAEEAAAYITETFSGDGTTATFELSEQAFRGTDRMALRDSFNETSFDPTQWVVTDPGSHLSITGAGLTCNGGTGADGATTLTMLDALEMGGSVVVQMSGVVFGTSSDGMLAGLYEGTPVLANCFAGFRVRQNAGVTVAVPVINGAEVGTVFTPTPGHTYTLRLRLHCMEMQRVEQLYYCMVDGVVQSFGSPSGVSAPMDAVFELVDEGAASDTPATVLYDSAAASGVGGIANTPAACSFVLVNATNLYGSIASVSVTRPGSIWIVSTLPGGTLQTRLIGKAGEGCDCSATYGTSTGTVGRVVFYKGRVPVAGETVAIMYRNQRRSVARMENAASVAAEAAVKAPGTCRWLGHVLQPVARSSADCESAAMAVLALGTSRAAALAGSYTAVNPPSDIWPGDILAITSAGVTTSLLVRSVIVEDGHAVPELLNYKIKFANDWNTELADGIGVKLNEAVSTDAYLPQTAATGPAQVLANLQQLTITGLTATTLTLNAGIAPPPGGGFEVRRSDWNFGPHVDVGDLVLRSPTSSFTVPLAAQVEQFYVRMYDASTPPLYSRFSAAVFINAPVS